MTDPLPFGGAIRSRRVIGPSERNVMRQLRKWRPWLSGDEHAADREKLRDLARNVDRARAMIEAGDDRAPSPYSYAMTRRVLADELARHAPPENLDDDDPWADIEPYPADDDAAP